MARTLSEKEKLAIVITQTERELSSENTLLSSPNHWHDPLTYYREGPRHGPGGSTTKRDGIIRTLQVLRKQYSEMTE